MRRDATRRPARTARSNEQAEQDHEEDRDPHPGLHPEEGRLDDGIREPRLDPVREGEHLAAGDRLERGHLLRERRERRHRVRAEAPEAVGVALEDDAPLRRADLREHRAVPAPIREVAIAPVLVGLCRLGTGELRDVDLLDPVQHAVELACTLAAGLLFGAREVEARDGIGPGVRPRPELVHRNQEGLHRVARAREEPGEAFGPCGLDRVGDGGVLGSRRCGPEQREPQHEGEANEGSRSHRGPMVPHRAEGASPPGALSSLRSPPGRRADAGRPAGSGTPTTPSTARRPRSARSGSTRSRRSARERR